MPSSTSNSRARVPALPYVREAIGTAIALAGLCVALMGFNAYFDPIDLKLSPWRAEINRRVYGPLKLPLRAATKLRRLPPEAFARARYAILGDSRGRQLSTSGLYTPRLYKNKDLFIHTNKDLFIEVAGAPVVNLAFGGASIGEAVDMFAGFAGDLKSLRAVILCTPIDAFGVLRHGGRVDDALAQSAQPWRYLLNLDTVITLFRPVRRRGGTHGRQLAPSSALWHDIVDRYRSAISHLQRGRVEEQLRINIDRLRAIAGGDVRLIFYIPPMAAELERAYARRGDLSRYILDRLSERGAVYDYALFDGVDSTFDFADPIHLLNGGRPVLEDIVLTFEGKREVSRFAAGGASPVFVNGR